LIDAFDVMICRPNEVLNRIHGLIFPFLEHLCYYGEEMDIGHGLVMTDPLNMARIFAMQKS